MADNVTTAFPISLLHLQRYQLDGAVVRVQRERERERRVVSPKGCQLEKEVLFCPVINDGWPRQKKTIRRESLKKKGSIDRPLKLASY